MVSAQRKDGHCRAIGTAFHSMQNASGVVHHAIRVYRGLELSLDKSLTHILGEARTH